MWYASVENFSWRAIHALVVCCSMRHDRYVDVSVSLQRFGCDVDFENLFPLLMNALKQIIYLCVFQSGVVNFGVRNS